MNFNRAIATAGLALALRFCALAQNSNDEVTLRGVGGDCEAYIAISDDPTIYLWNGDPVAYLVSRDIYGFNGKHLGWFTMGVVYDHEGDVVGAVTSRFKAAQSICPIKNIKSLTPLKSLKELRPLKPLFRLSWSGSVTLRRFLLAGWTTTGGTGDSQFH